MSTDILDLSPPKVTTISKEDSPISALVAFDNAQEYEFSIVEPISNNAHHIPQRRYLCKDGDGTLLYQLMQNERTGSQTLIRFDPELPVGNLCRLYHKGDLQAYGPRLTGEITPFGARPGKRYGLWREKIENGDFRGNYDEDGIRQGLWIENIRPGSNSMVQKNVWNYDQGKIVSQIGFKKGVDKPAIERRMNGSLNNMICIGRIFTENGTVERESRSIGGANDGVSLRPKNYTSKIVKDYYRKGKEIPQALYWWQENEHLLGEFKLRQFFTNMFKGKNENKSLFTEYEISRARKLDYTQGGI